MTNRKKYLAEKVVKNSNLENIAGQFYGLGPYGTLLSDYLPRNERYLTKCTARTIAALLTTTHEAGFDSVGVSHKSMFTLFGMLHRVDTTITATYSKVLEAMSYLLSIQTRNPNAPKEYWLSASDDFLSDRILEMATNLNEEYTEYLEEMAGTLAGTLTNRNLELVAAYLLRVKVRPHVDMELEELVDHASKYDTSLHDNVVDRKWYTSLWIEMAIRGFDSINNYADLIEI